MMSVLFSVVAPDKTSQLFKQYKGILFPEEKYDELAYIKKAKKFFERVRGMTIFAKRPKVRK